VTETAPVSRIPIDIDVEIVKPPSAETPPVLQTRISNRGEKPVAVGEKRRLMNHYALTEDETLLFVPTHELDGAAGTECWGIASYSTDFEYQVAKLPAGEQLTTRAYVVGWEEQSAYCLPPGDHRVRPDLVGGTEQEWRQQAETTLDWSFTLQITESS
jgi:hypothetical protein